MMNSVLIAIVIVSALLLMAVIRYKFEKEQDVSAWVDIAIILVVLVTFHRTISGVGIGIIVATVFSLFTLVKPPEVYSEDW